MASLVLLAQDAVDLMMPLNRPSQATSCLRRQTFVLLKQKSEYGLSAVKGGRPSMSSSRYDMI